MAMPTGEITSWLCPDTAARERMLDMDARIKKPRAAAFAVLFVAIASSFFDEGAWPAFVLAGAILAFGAMDVLHKRVQRPEYLIFASWAFAQVLIAYSIANTGGINSFAMSWLLVPVCTLPARFNARGVGLGVGFTAVLMAAVAIAVPPSDPGADFLGATYSLAGLVAVGLLSTALMQSDAEHRNDSVMDGLTGMLNRRSLEHRLEELEGQSELSGQPIAVLLADLDHFKRVNDEHGHATGDAVLVDVAYRIRKELRAFDLAYRMGGEEFLVLLPGASIDDAAEIAEVLRTAIAQDEIAGVAVTVSIGVAATEGGRFDSAAVLAEADGALYVAKASGRDRVVRAGTAPLAAVA